MQSGCNVIKESPYNLPKISQTHFERTKNNGHKVFYFDYYLVLKDQFLVPLSTPKPFLEVINLFKVNKETREHYVKPVQSYK